MGSIGQKDLFRLKLYKKRQNEKLSKLKINLKRVYGIQWEKPEGNNYEHRQGCQCFCS